MPELPEVEWGRKVAASICEGRTIVRARCAHDDIVLDGVTPARMARVLKGRRVERVCRWGKQLWFELDRGPHPLFHFGMTGAFHVPGGAPLPLASSPRRRPAKQEWPPRFTKIHLWLDDGGELVMVNKRRLGRIRLRESPREEPPLSGLGFDPLLAMPSPRTFEALVCARKVTLKGLLLDQSFAAGVGNWIADEVLYQAGIDPRRPAEDLTDDEIERLRRRLRDIVRRAVGWDADYRRFPRTWLFHRRWRLRESRNGEVCDVDGRPLTFDKVAGRTTAWVPAAQS